MSLSDCVRLKAVDIQPEIFSYLLNLMYTGRVPAQAMDPARLEQGVKFLHAYPLLQEASLSVNPAEPAHRSAPANHSSSSLYGIQISDQQGVSASHLSSSPSDDAGAEGAGGREVAVVMEADLEACGSLARPSAEEAGMMDIAYGDAPSCSPTESTAAAGTILHVKPSIMHRSGSFRKQHVCHVCGSRFLQRSALREHLLLHTRALLPLVADGGDAAAPTVPGGMTAPDIEELLRSGGIAMAAAAITAASSALACDGEQPAKESPRPDIPASISVATGSCALMGQPQADTPPPSDIADIDNLEGAADAEREVKRRKYECSTCGRKFIQKSHWREHMYIHTGKPFRCRACGKSFCRANQAARHVCLGQLDAERQAEDGQLEALFHRPYRCNVCDATFASPQQVLKHLCFSQVPYSAAAAAAPRPEDSQGPEAAARDEGSNSSSGSRDDAARRTVKSEEVLPE